MGKPAEKKQKKKGRPSLLDLQKRSLRLQKLQEQKKKRNPNPIPDAITNPYARFPIPSAGRRSSRRNPNPEPKSASPAEDEDDTEAAASMEDDEEDDDEPKERRKEKKLKLVLHLPHPNTNSPDLGSYASESNGTVPEKRSIDTVGKQTEGKNSAWKATEGLQGTSDSGPTTPLPDKKLLDFILDRLQKKDIYGVFSEPVDPEELPDYHDIIKHPMDFGTVRNKLSSGAYKDLEQFEKDVFLISSNAMRYNAPGTIYFRQARSINELAKKGFENLRHEGDGGEREPKIVRRGRPPGTGKNNFKRPVGRPPAERAGSEFSSEASLSNALNGNLYSGLRNDLLRKGSGQDQQRIAADVSVRPTQFIHSSEAYVLGSEHKSVRNEDCSGSAWKGFSNYGKKVSAMDESRRNTYKQSASIHECSVLEALDGERKVLLPVGFHAEYAYARSLARFAAHLGPIGWNIAAKRIEKVLPAGIKFGPGWVGEINALQSYPQSYRPQHSKPSLHSPSMQPNISAASGGDRHSERLEEHPFNNSVGKDRHFGTSLPPSSASISTIPHERFHDSSEAKGSSPFHHNATTQPLTNGFKTPFTPNLPTHPGMFLRPNPARGTFGLEAVIAQARTISTLSSKCSDSSGHELPSTLPQDEARATEPEINPTPLTNHVNSLPSSSKGPFPVVTVDSKKPDLALQL